MNTSLSGEEGTARAKRVAEGCLPLARTEALHEASQCAAEGGREARREIFFNVFHPAVKQLRAQRGPHDLVQREESSG